MDELNDNTLNAVEESSSIQEDSSEVSTLADTTDPIEDVPNNYEDTFTATDPRVYVGDTAPNPKLYRWWVNTSSDVDETDSSYSDGNTPIKMRVLEYQNGKWQTTTPGGYTFTGTMMGKLEQMEKGSTRIFTYDNLEVDVHHPMKALSAHMGYYIKTEYIDDIYERLDKIDEQIEQILERLDTIESNLSALTARVDAINSCTCEDANETNP